MSASQSPKYSFKSAFTASTCSAFGISGLWLFALSLRFNLDDIPQLMSDCNVDGGDDKKIDAIYIDADERQTAVIIQSYIAKNEKGQEPPSNKASDLNTAVPWLFSQPINKIPIHLRPHIRLLRENLSKGDINRIEFWYVHNLKESDNANQELSAVQKSASASIRSEFTGQEISIATLQVGNIQIEDWYLSRTNSIVIPDVIKLNEIEGYELKQSDWNSFSTYITGGWLKKQYAKYGDKLFSANIRGYLGSRRSDKNINNKIKESCTTEPSNFWVYNNGITCLVNKYDYNEEEKILKINGLSIVNGAQTTGAIGSVDKIPKEVLLPARFVECQDSDIIEKIIRYNNSQNKITAADFRSNDSIQRRLRAEFDTLPDTKYNGRRGGAEDVIHRQSNLISSDTVAQALTAFHGDPILAYNKRSEIWENDSYYSKYFNSDTTAAHILLTYSLLKCIESKKSDLRERSDDLGKDEELQFKIFKYRGSTYLFVYVISQSLEIIMGKPIHQKFDISFGNKQRSECVEIWEPIIDTAIPFIWKLESALENGLNNKDKVNSCTLEFTSLLSSTKTSNRKIFRDFSKKVVEE